jgi:hypothetical protein
MLLLALVDAGDLVDRELDRPQYRRTGVRNVRSPLNTRVM